MPLTLLGWLLQESATIPNLTPWLFGLALLISASGFYRTVYFVSIGYAFSIAAMAVTTLLVFRRDLTWFNLLQNVFLAVYGLRLGTYLLRREAKSSFSKERESITQRTANLTFGRKIPMWIGVSLLYVLMFSPSLFSLTGTPRVPAPAATVLQLLGLALMFGGLGVEALADAQKSNFKAQNPRQYCDVGLYRWVRCPNYLGEIMLWLGNWVLGFVFYTSVLQWIASLAGLVCIVLIMMGSTKRLEQAQDERYGAQPAYQAYTRTVPVLFPFVPIYSLKRVRVFLE
jgi:steroid 5-alpha reductase family enzyme